jgi:hypothetical protein
LGCGIVVVFPAASYAGVTQVAPVLALMVLIWLTELEVRF